MAQLGNSPRQHTVVRVEARKSFSMAFTVEKRNGAPVNLTGCTIRFVLAQPKHRGGAVLVTKTLTLHDAENGLAWLDVQASELDLTEDEYPFAITLVTATSYSSLTVKGVFSVQENVDPAEDVHIADIPPQGLTAILSDTNQVTLRLDHVPDIDLQLAAAAAEAAAASATAAAASLVSIQALLDLVEP